MTSLQEERNFAKHIGNEDALERSIVWISENLNPEDVFSEDDLKYWAESNGFIED